MGFKMKQPSTHQGTLRHKQEIQLNRSMDNTSLSDGRAGSSPFQQKTHVKPEKEGKSKYHYKKNIKKDQHNIDAEKFNPTGEYCITCGKHKSEHSGATISHKFKKVTPSGPDTKPSPTKQAIGGGPGEAIEHWQKYKSAKAQDAAVDKLATNKNISRKAFDSKLAKITKTVNPHPKSSMPKNFNIKGDPSTTPGFSETKIGKKLNKYKHAKKGDLLKKYYKTHAKSLSKKATQALKKGGKFLSGKALGVAGMMMATSSKADQPTKKQGGGQMDPNWLKK